MSRYAESVATMVQVVSTEVQAVLASVAQHCPVDEMMFGLGQIAVALVDAKSNQYVVVASKVSFEH